MQGLGRMQPGDVAKNSTVAACERDRRDVMEAMVAACVLVAHADGRLDDTERRRLLKLMRASPVFVQFPLETVAAEFVRQEEDFAYEPFRARDMALDALEALEVSVGEARAVVAVCQHILEADGVYHPQEYRALSEISRALGMS